MNAKDRQQVHSLPSRICEVNLQPPVLRLRLGVEGVDEVTRIETVDSVRCVLEHEWKKLMAENAVRLREAKAFVVHIPDGSVYGMDAVIWGISR